MSKKAVLLGLAMILLFGCLHDKSPDPTAMLPDVKVAKTLPQFANKKNQSQINENFNEVDPSWVVGSLINVRKETLSPLENYLKADTKLKPETLTEVIFKDFVENSLTANVEWLSFLKGKIDDTIRAEVSVIKSGKVTAPNTAIELAKLKKAIQNIPLDSRADYGLVIGYIDFVLTATLFKNQGAEGAISGYGAKIGSTWYSKHEQINAHHRLIAIWAPLPFVLKNAGEKGLDLEQAVENALQSKELQVQELKSIRILK